MTSIEFGETDLSAILDPAFKKGGVMELLAQASIEQATELNPDEVAEVILPQPNKGTSLEPRWQLVDGAKDTVKEMAGQHEDEIFSLANRLGMRHEESLSERDTVRIQPDVAIWTVEGGANRTSVVRRQLAIDAMRAVYGDSANEHRLFQFGSDREIPSEKSGKPNTEYAVVQEIGGDFLPKRDVVTEFEANLASALQAGYETNGIIDIAGKKQQVVMTKSGFPELVLIKPPKVKEGGLEDGFTYVARIIGSLDGKQLVIATNGQYRPKDETQAYQWAQLHNHGILPSVAIGDESGYTVSHLDKDITTGNRLPMVYVNEMVILRRLLAQAVEI